MGQKVHFSSLQWVMQSAPPYMRLPLPTRRSTQMPNEHRNGDNLAINLTRTSEPSSVFPQRIPLKQSK